MVVSVVWDIDSYIYAMIDNVKTNFTCKLSNLKTCLQLTMTYL